MLSLERPIGQIAGVQVFRDHQPDSGQFWYINDRPRIAVNDGEPEFVFVKFREDFRETLSDTAWEKLGGGIVAFTVDLRVADDTLEEIRDHIRRLVGGEPILSPVLFEEGSVRLSIMSETTDDKDAQLHAQTVGAKLFEQVWGSTVPSLVGNNRATFGVRLDETGAAAFEAALQTGVGFIGVLYDLKFKAMRPAYEVRVVADYERIYTSFEGQLAAKVPIKAVMLQAQVDAAWRQLIETSAIKVEVTDFGTPADVEAAVEWAKGKILEDFFEASLPVPKLLSEQSGGGSDLGQLVATTVGEFGEKLSRNGIESKKPVAKGGADTKSDAPADTPGGTPGTEEPPPATPPGPQELAPKDAPPAEPESDKKAGDDDVTGAPDGAGGDLPEKAGAGATEQPGRGDTGSMFPISVGLRLRFLHQEERKTRTIEFNRREAVDRRVAPCGLISSLAGGIDLSDNIIEVTDSNFDWMRALRLRIRPDTDWSALKVKATTTHVEYPDGRAPGVAPAASGAVSFTPADGGDAQRFFETFLNPARDTGYRYRTDVRFAADSDWIGQGPVHVGPWRSGIGSGDLLIDAAEAMHPYPVTITADPDIFAVVRESNVRFRYYDEANDWEVVRSISLTETHPEEVLRLRLSDPTRDTYSVSVSHELHDGTIIEMPSQLTLADGDELDLDRRRGTSTLVPAPFARLLRVEIEPPLLFSSVSDAIVEVRYEDPTGGPVQIQRVVFRSSDADSWTAERRAFAVFGEQPEPWRTPIRGPLTWRAVYWTPSGKGTFGPVPLTTNRVTFDDVPA